MGAPLTRPRARRHSRAMTDAITPLAADFPAPDEATWRALAEAALKGQPFDRLTARTRDGVAIAPLYRETDFASAQDAAGLPGQAPFIRGGAAVRDAYAPWDIRQAVTAMDADTAQAAAAEELAGGATSLEMVVGDGGLAPAALSSALEGVMLDLAPVALDSGRDGLAPARALALHYRAHGAPANTARPVFNLDPLSAWMRDGAASDPIDYLCADATAFAVEAAREWPLSTAWRASGRSAHEAGATPAQELAVMVAAGLVYLRQMEAAGIAPVDGARRLVFALSVGPDVAQEIAKLRAARLLWSNVMAACGAAPRERAMTLQAISSLRMMTRDDAWTNILRTTAACFAAAVGGADSVTIAPCTAALGAPSKQSRRIARNTQIILMEESHLGRVADPGGGAWAIETLTQEIAARAWVHVQAIEAEGGLIAALRKGRLQNEIRTAHDAVMADIARRTYTITGVSDFPLLDETPPECAAWAAPVRPSLSHDAIAPLDWVRLSEPFEALRARARPAAPQAFCATLGALSAFSARANFAKTLLAAGGVRLVGDDVAYTDDAARIAAFTASGCCTAILCGSDTAYDSSGESVVRALKAAGADWIVYAGKPDNETRWREAGVSQFVFAGQNAIDALTRLHTALGLTI